MDITYYGKDNIKIITKNLAIQLNPQSQTKADVLLLSQQSDENTDAIVFDGPGEYEVRGVMLDGISLGADNTAFTLSSEDMKFAYMTGKVSELTDKQVEAFGGVDVLAIALDSQPGDVSVKLINQIETRIVLPFNYSDEALASFLKEIGGEADRLERLKLSKRDLPEDNQKVVILTQI